MNKEMRVSQYHHSALTA